MIIHVDIATMKTTDKQGAGTANFEIYDDLMMEFVSGEPCTECVNARYARDQHSICQLMIDERR